MLAFVIRRLLYSIPVALGVYGITFALFHIRDPMAIARTNLSRLPCPFYRTGCEPMDITFRIS